MFYIIEKNTGLDRLHDLGDCFVHFIPFNYKFHPVIQTNKISLVYIRSINQYKGYILCINHNESLNIDFKLVLDWLPKNIKKIFVLNKKDTLHLIGDKFQEHIYDINFIKQIDFNYELNSCFKFFYQKQSNSSDLNCLIPISKHYEILEEIYFKVKPIIKNFINDTQYIDNSFGTNNFITSKVFYEIERQGIKLNKKQFLKYYEDIMEFPELNIQKGKIFTSYNLYTTTGRPSNNYNGINFGALSKTNGERNCYTTGKDELIELDFEAYHPRLIAEIVQYNFSKPVYEELGQYFYNKEILIEEELKDSKLLTFQQLYGGIDNKHTQHGFFNKVQKYQQQLIEEFNNEGIECGIRKFIKSNVDLNKIFNYTIQAKETFNNIQIIEEIQQYLRTKETKLILYTYDAFLFDYSHSDGQECLDHLIKIMRYPVKIKRGLTYGGLERSIFIHEL